MSSFFTATPNFDEAEGWTKFIGRYVVVQPQSRLSQVKTKFGNQDCWDCVVWEVSHNDFGNFLVPTPGIRIFNSKLVSTLDLAYSQGAPLAGLVYKGGRNGQATVMKDDGSPTMALLSTLWCEGSPIQERDLTPVSTDARP